MKHKTALVAAMSIAAVVLAGAAALAANLGILNSSNEVGSLSAVDAGSTTSTTGPEVVAYQIAGVGVVTLTRSGDDLHLQSAAVGEWTYEVDDDDDDGIEITFRSGDREIEFTAEVEDGQILVSVTEEDVIVQGSSGSTAPTPVASTGDDEQDDDQYEDDYEDEDEDHEDEDHEEEHEEEDEAEHADDDD